MDLILLSGKIVTMDSLGQIVEAVGIKNGKIAVIGTNDEVLSKKDMDTNIIDLKNKLVLPGFIDSHMHMLNYGYTSLQLQLSNCNSINDIIESGKEHILDNDLQYGRWLLGRGWNQDNFTENRFPTKDDLDRISLNHPICLTRVCGHIAIANSMAMKIAKERVNQKIDNENIDWELGIFKEDGINTLYGAIESPSTQEIKDMLVLAANAFIQSGITSVHTDDFAAMPDRDFKRVLRAYEELIEEDRLSIRVYEQCLLPNIEILKEFLDQGYRTGKGNEKFKIGPLKLLIDGSLGARTAFLCNRYNDDPSTDGIAVYSQEELNELVLLANKNNVQVAIHAIGDGAMYMALDSIKYAKKQCLRKEPRHGIIHCQITNEEILDRFRDENILAYIQPIFLDYDLHIVEDRIGSERAKKTYNWKSMLERGIKVSGGSDTPVVGFNIFENIYSAVTRMDLNKFPKGGWLPEEKLTVYEAVKLFTINGAYASFEEDIKGTLKLGKLADMVVLSQDIFQIDEEKIKDVRAVMTIIDGKVVYKN